MNGESQLQVAEKQTEKRISDAKTVVSIRDLRFSYEKGSPALSGVTLDVREGEYLVVMGANGAGKTTLCLHLNGVLPVVLGGFLGGEIDILGHRPYERKVYENALDVGMILQDPEAQLFSSSVVSEVAFAAENHGIPRDEMLDLVDWALEVVRLSDYKDGSPPNLSGGQKQRLVIASNLVIRPKVLVLDEPTAQLDPLGTSEVFSTLNDLNREFGMTVIVATHKIDEVVEFADRIALLEEGSLVLHDVPRKAFFEGPRFRDADTPVPEPAEIDYHLREIAAEKGYAKGRDYAATTVEEGAELIGAAIREGILKPSKDYKKALGREVSEERSGVDTEEVLRIDNVSYRYNKKDPLALDDVTLSINRNEIVGVIGQNGAGKTTLMKCVTGILEPQQGSIHVLDQDVCLMKSLDVARCVGLILQHPDNQLFEMSVEEEIGFALKNLELPEEEVQRRIDETLELVGLEHERKTYPFNLGMADRRKCAVAAIYAMHPDILIFDEPTTGQDFKGRYQLCDLALRLQGMGATVLIISHDMTLIGRYTQRTVVMGKAKVLLDAPTREVFSAQHRDVLRSTFLAPPAAGRLAQRLEGEGLSGDILTVEELVNALTGKEVQGFQHAW